jgi:peptidoglycan/LPS O-acetylase OafA/YrhL
LLGYESSIGLYAWVPSGSPVFVQTAAAGLLIASVGCCPALRKNLDGQVGQVLGRYSFPVYLIHVLMILSVGMFSFVALYPLVGLAVAQVGSILMALACTFIVAHCLSLLETRWIGLVSNLADQVVNVARWRKASLASLVVESR